MFRTLQAATRGCRLAQTMTTQILRSHRPILIPTTTSHQLLSASFSTAAPTPATTTPTSSAPAPERTIFNHYPVYPGDGKSPTELILEVLKSGPKTRKQLFYALNHGPPKPEDLAKVDAILKAQATASKKKVNDPALQPPHAYPTGILRNMRHLNRILNSLMNGKRLWAKPMASIEKRLGENELQSIDVIEKQHPQAALIQANGGLKGYPGKVRSGKQVQVGPSWLYILRDWADPGFGAKTPEKHEQWKAKLERRKTRREAKLVELTEGIAARAAAAKEKGVHIPVELPIVTPRRAEIRYKLAHEAQEKLEAQALSQAEKKFKAIQSHERGLEVPADQAHMIWDLSDMKQLLSDLNGHAVTGTRAKFWCRYAQMTDFEYEAALKLEKQSMHESAVKLSIAKRKEMIHDWLMTRLTQSQEEFDTYLTNRGDFKGLPTGPEVPLNAGAIAHQLALATAEVAAAQKTIVDLATVANARRAAAQTPAPKAATTTGKATPPPPPPRKYTAEEYLKYSAAVATRKEAFKRQQKWKKLEAKLRSDAEPLQTKAARLQELWKRRQAVFENPRWVELIEQVKLWNKRVGGISKGQPIVQPKQEQTIESATTA